MARKASMERFQRKPKFEVRKKATNRTMKLARRKAYARSGHLIQEDSQGGVSTTLGLGNTKNNENNRTTRGRVIRNEKSIHRHRAIDTSVKSLGLDTLVSENYRTIVSQVYSMVEFEDRLNSDTPDLTKEELKKIYSPLIS